MNQIEILNFILKHKGTCSEIWDQCSNCPIDCYFSDTDEDTMKKATELISEIKDTAKDEQVRYVYNDTVPYIYSLLRKSVQDLIDRGECIETIITKIQDVDYD